MCSRKADAKVLLAELGMTDLANADLELVWFDDNSILNGGSGAAGNINTRGARADGRAAKRLDCYIDGFRVYNPLDVDSSKYIATAVEALIAAIYLDNNEDFSLVVKIAEHWKTLIDDSYK